MVADERIREAERRGLSSKIPPELTTSLDRMRHTLTNLEVVPNEDKAENIAGELEDLFLLIRDLERIFDPEPPMGMISLLRD
jgi:hypothetical protein